MKYDFLGSGRVNMLEQIHLLAAVTVLGVLEQGRDHWMHLSRYLLGQSAVPPLISSHFPICFCCCTATSPKWLIPCLGFEKCSTK